tara:strand:- start:578 stop:1411 length:834 start_codon:yes stop_codon:yes gene_type:complete
MFGNNTMSHPDFINHTVDALNISASSENKIHDDSIAKRFGFQGGLVPGVEVYAYMTNPIVQFFGYQWLEIGSMECKFIKPVYDGDQTNIKASKNRNTEILIEVTTPTNFCARGIANLDKAEKKIQLTPDEKIIPSPNFNSRPKASPASLNKGKLLGTFQQLMIDKDQHQYLQDIRESLSLYRDEKIIHPGWVLRMANKALSTNVKLGPWIHVGSKIQNYNVAHCGDTLSAQTSISDSYEHKGHLFVEMDVKIVNSIKCFTHIIHTAIYRPRPVNSND